MLEAWDQGQEDVLSAKVDRVGIDKTGVVAVGSRSPLSKEWVTRRLPG